MIRFLSSMLIVFTASVANAAFEFSPIISNLAPSGSGATSTFTVANTGDTKIPVQISIVPREPDESGKEVYAESEEVADQFRIFPGQLVLNPKETRSVRVTYIGNPKIKSELAYRIIAEELPVDISDPKKVYTKAVANVTIAIKYVGSIYVTPTGAKSQLNLEVVDATVKKEGPSEKKSDLILLVTNKGSAHEIVRKPVLKLESLVDKSEVVLYPKDLPMMSNLNILSGKTRKFTMEWPNKLPLGPVKASFDLPKE